MPVFLLPILGLLKNTWVIVGGLLKNPYVIAALAVAGVALWGLHETRRADGLQARLTASDAALSAAHAVFLKEQATLHKLIAARTADHADAVTDANGQAKTCQARVDTARKSATAITRILNEPPHANLDPAEPELLSAGELRSAQGR